MTEEEIRQNAFAMPYSSPAFPPGPYRFTDREHARLDRIWALLRIRPGNTSDARRCAWFLRS